MSIGMGAGAENETEAPRRVAVVTGGGSGIGAASVARLLRAGHRVCAADVDAGCLDRLGRELDDPADLFSCVVDVASPAGVESLRAALAERFGRPADVLVTCAGVRGPSKPAWELTPDEWRQVHAVDLDGVFLCCRAFVPDMLVAGWGRVINVSSTYGKEGFPSQSAYASAKAGVIAFGRSLSREVADRGVLVHTVTPGAIATPMTDAIPDRERQYAIGLIPLGRAGRPEEVAELVCLLAGDRISFSTGSTWDISGGKSVS